MDFNDGSQYRVVTDPAAQLAEREVYCFRVASARNGVPYIDTAFAQHREQLREMPALLMYQFVWQDAGTPEAQANLFCDTIGELRPNEMVMLDIEVGGKITDPADFARRWLAVVEGRLQTRAWLYIPRALSAALQPLVDGRIIMAPRYSGSASRGTAPDWPHDVHQYTDKGYFPGCTQTGDVSFTNLTVAQMLDRSSPGRNSMPSSYNGWSAGPGWTVKGGQLQALVVAGEPFSPGVRAGDVHDVLEYVANQLHRRVEPVVRSDWHQADDWGYSYRANTNNPSQLSCHASGTAIDYNATRHPNGKGGTWTAAQRAEIDRILAEVNHTVRCLYGYDEMHFEIKGNAAQVAAAAAKVRGGGGSTAPSTPADPNDDFLTLGDKGPAVVALQEVLNRWYPKLAPLVLDGDFGQATLDRVKYFQERAGLKVDGEVGPGTRAPLGLKPPKEYTINAPVGEPAPAPPPPPDFFPGGDIEHVYKHLPQGLRDALGKVIVPEHHLPDAGGGWLVKFEGLSGHLYHGARVGQSFLIQGAILGAYGSQDWERGPLGWPLSHEFEWTRLDRDGQPHRMSQSNFEGGYIVFDHDTATAKVVHR